MKLNELEIENFRNIEKMNIEPCETVNIIFGENAQGKTNLLEGIWLFTGCKSFRGTKDRELVSFGKNKSKLKLDYFGEERDQYIEIEIEEKRQLSKNGIHYSSPSKAFGNIRCVVFSPVHLNLIKQGPSERRKFLDAAISQLKPGYASVLTDYNRAIRQRNVFLKDASFHSEIYGMLDIWDRAIAKFSSKIALYRYSYLERLKEETEEIYSGISSNREKISLKYIQSCGLEKPGSEDEYFTALLKARSEDYQTGNTSVGIHRDDFEILIDGVSARNFGSQGQQRSAALALKLGEANMTQKTVGEQPIMLLDDVMSELDVSRQDYILNHIKDRQVFITCCDPNTVKSLKGGKSFEIEKGKLISVG